MLHTAMRMSSPEPERQAPGRRFLAKLAHGDTDHKYEITAEVTDASRRTITGSGAVSVARKPFKVYAWVDHGYYAVGAVIRADFSAQPSQRGLRRL